MSIVFSFSSDLLFRRVLEGSIVAAIQVFEALFARTVVIALHLGRFAARTGDGGSCAFGQAASLLNFLRGHRRVHFQLCRLRINLFNVFRLLEHLSEVSL